MKVDAITRLDGMSVICSLRTVTYNKTILANLDTFREGWRGRKQAQSNKVTCENAAFRPMAARGWRFTQNLTFLSGERETLDAKC